MKSKTKKIKCANCGKPFAPKTANAKYCSPKCKAAVKNAKKRVDRKSAKASLKAAPKKKPSKTAFKVATVQKVKLPKPPPQPRLSPEAEKVVCDAYNAQRDRFLLIGMSLSLLVKTLFDSCENIKAVCKHDNAAKTTLKKAK